MQIEGTLWFSEGLSAALRAGLWKGSGRWAQAAVAVAEGTWCSCAWGRAQVALTITHGLAAVSSCSCSLQLCPWGALCSCSLSQGHACPAATPGDIWYVKAEGVQEFWLTSELHPKWLCFAPVCEWWILDHLLPPLCEFCLEWYIIYLGL